MFTIVPRLLYNPFFYGMLIDITYKNIMFVLFHHAVVVIKIQTLRLISCTALHLA